MKPVTLTFIFIFYLFLFSSPLLQAQSIPGAGNPSWKTAEPWKSNQLMQPADLAALINNPKAKKPLIFNIGVVENIKGARNIGPASVNKNLSAFEGAIKGVPKNAAIVVYCGCCPFNNRCQGEPGRKQCSFYVPSLKVSGACCYQQGRCGKRRRS